MNHKKQIDNILKNNFLLNNKILQDLKIYIQDLKKYISQIKTDNLKIYKDIKSYNYINKELNLEILEKIQKYEKLRSKENIYTNHIKSISKLDSIDDTDTNYMKIQTLPKLSSDMIFKYNKEISDYCKYDKQLSSTCESIIDLFLNINLNNLNFSDEQLEKLKYYIIEYINYANDLLKIKDNLLEEYEVLIRLNQEFKSFINYLNNSIQTHSLIYKSKIKKLDSFHNNIEKILIFSKHPRELQYLKDSLYKELIEPIVEDITDKKLDESQSIIDAEIESIKNIEYKKPIQLNELV